VNSLIGLEAMRLRKALGPGLRNAICVAILTEVGRLAASTMAWHGVLALVTIGTLPALVMAYLELPRAWRLSEVTIDFAAYGRRMSLRALRNHAFS
jgi:hypothetical protein